MKPINLRIAEELGVREQQVAAAISLVGPLSLRALEDLYLPYRPNRRTKAQLAREAGLEPLAEALLTRPDQNPEQLARRYVAPNKGTLSCFPAQKSVL
jgi:transcriptional accessory protein Tex/SPT6